MDVSSGIITFINAVEGCLIELNLRGGEVVLDASCVGGNFYAEGYGTLYNESSMVVVKNHLLALETIPAPILNSVAADYDAAGTIGAAINDVQTIENPSLIDIANTVWAHATATQINNNISFIKGIEGGKWVIANNQMVFYAENNITELARFNLFNSSGTPATDNVTRRDRVVTP